MNSGIVMEVSERHIIVMTPEGGFEQLPAKNRSCQLGEEITYAPRPSHFRYPRLSTVSIFTAAVIFCLILFTTLPGLFADKTVVAYVSIDINPSVEAGIDGKKIVREVRGLNDQGSELIGTLKYKGKPLAEFAEALLQKAEEKQYLKQGEGDIVIASTLVKDGAKVDDNLLSETLKQQVLAHLTKKNPGQTSAVQVTAFAAPKEVREAAMQNGLSLGKYAVYLEAKSAGYDLKLDDFKKDSVHNLAKENGGIDKLVDVAKLNKDNIKNLLKEEKDGSLDKVVEESKRKKEEESRKQGKSTPKPANPSSKPDPAVTPDRKPGASSKPQQKPSKQDSNDNDSDSKKNTPERSASPRQQDDGKKDSSKQDEKKDSEKKTNDVKTNEKKDNGKSNGKKDIGMAEENREDLILAGDAFVEENTDVTTGEDYEKGSDGQIER